MKIGFLVRAHPDGQRSPIMREMVHLLSQWGAEVDLICPDESPICLTRSWPHHDLYVLKSSSEGALSFAGALHATGARIINPFPVAAMLKDKAIVYRILQRARIPTPPAYAAARPSDLAPVLEDGAIVVKPARGSQGRGIRVVRDRAELEQLPAGSGPVIAQRYKAPDRFDHKIYCINGQVFGVEREWPARTYRQKLGRPLTISAELRDITLMSGRAFGIDVFGIDVIFSNGQAYVVDVNSFPGFKGVPDAALRLADYVYTCAQDADWTASSAGPRRALQ